MGLNILQGREAYSTCNLPLPYKNARNNSALLEQSGSQRNTGVDREILTNGNTWFLAASQSDHFSPLFAPVLAPVSKEIKNIYTAYLEDPLRCMNSTEGAILARHTFCYPTIVSKSFLRFEGATYTVLNPYILLRVKMATFCMLFLFSIGQDASSK